MYIEALWETAVQKHRIEKLWILVDKALDERDSFAFYQYSAELAELRTVKSHGQVTFKG